MMLNGAAITAASPSDPTEQIWIYRWFDAAGMLLYVGTTNDVEARTKVHRNRSYWWPWAARVEVSESPIAGRLAAEATEAEIIRTESPIFNLDWRSPEADARVRQYRQQTPRYVDRDGIPADVVARQVWLTPDEWARVDALTSTGRLARSAQVRNILRHAVLEYLDEREPVQS